MGGGILTNLKNIFSICFVEKKQPVNIPLVNIFAFKIIHFFFLEMFAIIISILNLKIHKYVFHALIVLDYVYN